jgi:alpha-tubulin suppressor-like RCC1 family protein
MKLYCWGNGVGDEPILVDGTMAWSKLSIGRDHFCGTNGNGLYCWGDNAFGQLGNGNASEIPVASPSQIEGETWSEIVAGSQHTCGIKQGFLYCWGSRKFGEIANQFSNSAPGSN